MFGNSSHLNSLIQYHRGLCYDRDSLSLFVEYCGNNTVRVHRQFYVYDEFKSFLTENDFEKDKLNLKDTVNDIELNQFGALLIKLINERSINFDDERIIDELLIMVEKFRFDKENNNNEEVIEKYLDDINEVFCKYCFSINDNAFRYDEVIYSKINELVNITEYNPSIHYEDYVDGCKPEIEPVHNVNLYELRVYNVGQANCSALIKYKSEEKNDYDVIVVFDLGYQKNFKTNNKLDDMIKKINGGTTIVISHYDSDHINNIANHLYITTSRWIFPNYDGKGKKALKTFQTLLKVAKKKTGSGTIHSFPSPFNISPNISIHQYSGVRKLDPYQSTLMNSKCLVCKLSIGEKDILIPADALYEEFGSELVLPNNKKYDFVLIPHHGCKYIGKASARRTIKIWKFIDEHTVGYVMCGKNNYGHANDNHISWFNNVNFFNNTFIYDDNKNLINVNKTEETDFLPIHFI